jgi:uncharacterized damage-inducible protein DinB
MDETAQEFLRAARRYLRGEYLPKIERCLERLTDEQVWLRPSAETNSVGNLLLHLEGNARQWILGGVAGAQDRRVRQAEFDERGTVPREELLGRLRATLDEIDAVLAALGPAELLARRLIQGYDVNVLGAVFHVVEHFSMHTGQVILLTKAIAACDLGFYDVSSGDPRRNWDRPAGAD